MTPQPPECIAQALDRSEVQHPDDVAQAVWDALLAEGELLDGHDVPWSNAPGLFIPLASQPEETT